jgi:hypothetical protein
VFAHNTIYRNTANTGVPGGLRCIGTGTARHNIIYGSLGTIVEYNLVGGCSHEHSLIGTIVAPGTGNITASTVDEIHFVNITNPPLDLHITTGSIAFGKGGPNDGAAAPSATSTARCGPPTWPTSGPTKSRDTRGPPGAANSTSPTRVNKQCRVVARPVATLPSK